MINLVSLFSGAGGLDLGFQMAGYNTVWACDTDQAAVDTFAANNVQGVIVKRSIVDVGGHTFNQLKGVEGVIGGPPCQSWSLGGAGRGASDLNGQLFNHYIRAISTIKPKFFVAENVPGLLSKRHSGAYEAIIDRLASLGYLLNSKVLNAADYGVAQDRKRLIIVGYRKDLDRVPSFPKPLDAKTTLKEALYLLPSHPVLSMRCESSYSPRYMSRNRAKGWYDQSYTIVASASQVPQHPDVKMWQSLDKLWHFEGTPKRLSALECARIQSYPDTFRWSVSNLAQAYRLIGNSVPPLLANVIARHIKAELG